MRVGQPPTFARESADCLVGAGECGDEFLRSKQSVAVGVPDVGAVAARTLDRATVRVASPVNAKIHNVPLFSGVKIRMALISVNAGIR